MTLDFDLSDSMVNKKKRTFTEEHRLKISMAKKGRPHSDEHCQNISAALRGKTFSEEHKEKISKALQGNRNALRNDIKWSDELMFLYGEDEGCRLWIEKNKEALDGLEDIKTDYQISQDNLKENTSYDDAIKLNSHEEITEITILDFLILNVCPIKESQEIKLDEIL